MSQDRSFTRSNEFREISDRELYYDLEFSFKNNNHQVETTSQSVIVYLFFVSLAMMFIFDIQQIATLFFIAIYAIIQKYFIRVFGIKQKLLGIVSITLSTIIDHLIGGTAVSPGRITTEQLSIAVWALEILWIVLLAIEFLSIFTPRTNIYSDNTITPATGNSEKQFQSLKNRIQGTDYEMTDFEQDVDTSLVQKSFRNILQYLLITFAIILALDILIWEVTSILSGGNNIQEAYFVSGISFIIYLAIISSSARLFPDDKSSQK